jgi:NAD(P)H-dependent FMN reductase
MPDHPRRILMINGSYRDDGITDQVVAEMSVAAREAGAEVEEIVLRDRPIEFCLNCRHCTQTPGSAPGQCVHEDAMAGIVEAIERADAYVLAAPTNAGTVTALFKRFLERLVVYAFWPWGQPAPAYRKAPTKRAVLVSSSAAPGIIGRWVFGSIGQLKMAARYIGAKPVGTLFTGLVANEPHKQIPERVIGRARRLATRLATT